MKIVVLDAGTLRFPESEWEALGSFGELVLHEKTSSDPVEIQERSKGADVILSNKVPLRSEVLDKLEEGILISVMATGTNNVDLEAAKARGITVCNVPAYSTPSVAQHTFALLCAMTNKAELYGNSVARGDWVRSEQFSYWHHEIPELAGRTLGLIGFGEIGRQVGSVGHALGMRVMASMRNPRNAPDWDGFAFASNEEIFEEADVVSLHCPQTEENTGFVDAALLGRMKPGAFLINTSRGGLINEEDLVEALNSNRLAGAALDVLSTEPMEKDSPLFGARNLLITPHLAWASLEARRRLLAITRKNVSAFAEGTPINVVNA